MKNHGFVQAVNTIKFELSLTNFELWQRKRRTYLKIKVVKKA